MWGGQLGARFSIKDPPPPPPHHPTTTGLLGQVACKVDEGKFLFRWPIGLRRWRGDGLLEVFAHRVLVHTHTDEV